MKNQLITGCLLGSLMLAGCRSSRVEPPTPELAEPEAWVSPMSSEEKLAARELAVWWTQFDDETLTRLVQGALDENLDLRSAAARVEEAFALRDVAAGERVPQVNGSGGVFATRLSDLGGGASAPDRSFTAYRLGVDASWELDLWGRIRQTVDAADAGARASVEDLRGIRALIASQVAAGYITLRELQLRQKLTKENISRQRETLKLTRGRFDAGLVPKLDVNQAIQNLSSTEAGLPLLRQQETQTIHALEVLGGMMPGALGTLLENEKAVPVVQQAQLNDVPANVLRRRPDIRAAEQRLVAAALRVGVARADLYPRISLSGSFAWEGNEAGDLFNSHSVATRFGPGISLPIFQGGRLRAQVDAAASRALQAELSYRQLVLEALQEVENALTAYREEQMRLEKLQEGVVAGEATVLQVRSLYENGLVTFLNVLDAERNLAALQDQAAASLGQSSRNLVSVYRAFGGGWDAPEFDQIVPLPEVKRMPLSHNRAEARVSEKHHGIVKLNIEAYTQYTRLHADSVGMVTEIEMGIAGVSDSELKSLLAGLLPGERLALSWKEVQVVGPTVDFIHAELEDAERLSPQSP